MTIPLDLERMRFSELRRRLVELYPDLDEQTLADTLEGATNLKEAVGAVIRSALEDECFAKALKERIDTLRQRLSRLEARANALRQSAREAMEEADLRKLIEADFTASLKLTPPAVEIIDEQSLPIEFLIPQPHKIDKRAVLTALNDGIVVPGATLTEPKVSLSVRSL